MSEQKINYNIVTTYDDLDTLNALPGTMVHIEDEEKTYICNPEGNWEEVDGKDCQLNMNLYELNKTAVLSLPDLKTSQIEVAKSKIAQYRNEIKADFYMLLGRDLNYYTVFDMTSTSNEQLEEVVIECLQWLGNIKSYEVLWDNKSIEFWIVTEDNEAYVLYLFDFTSGVIACL